MTEPFECGDPAGLIGYLYGAAGFISFELQLPMALNTALFFLAACFAILAAHPNEGVTALFVSDSAGGAITRRLLRARGRPMRALLESVLPPETSGRARAIIDAAADATP